MTLKDRVELCARRRPGVTQADIARAAGIKQPSVTDWFNGKTNRLKLKPAVKAAELWGCNPLWLGEGEGMPGWLDGTKSVQEPIKEYLIPQPPDLPAALDRLGIELAKAAPELREALALNLAGWARAGGQGPWQNVVQGLLSALPRKVQNGR